MELAHVHPVIRACRVFLMKLAHVHPVLTSPVRNAMCIQQLPRPLVYRYDMQATSCQGTSYDYTTAAAAYCSIAMLPAVSVGHDCKHYQVLAVSACLFTVDTYSYFGVHVHTLYWQYAVPLVVASYYLVDVYLLPVPGNSYLVYPVQQACWAIWHIS